MTLKLAMYMNVFNNNPDHTGGDHKASTTILGLAGDKLADDFQKTMVSEVFTWL